MVCNRSPRACKGRQEQQQSPQLPLAPSLQKEFCQKINDHIRTKLAEICRWHIEHSRSSSLLTKGTLVPRSLISGKILQVINITTTYITRLLVNNITPSLLY